MSVVALSGFNRPDSQWKSFLGFAEIKWRFITLMIRLCCFRVWRFIGFVRKQSSLSKYLQWFDRNWWGIFWSQAIFSGQFQSNDKSKQNGYLSNIPSVRSDWASQSSVWHKTPLGRPSQSERRIASGDESCSQSEPCPGYNWSNS